MMRSKERLLRLHSARCAKCSVLCYALFVVFCVLSKVFQGRLTSLALCELCTICDKAALHQGCSLTFCKTRWQHIKLIASLGGRITIFLNHSVSLSFYDHWCDVGRGGTVGRDVYK